MHRWSFVIGVMLLILLYACGGKPETNSTPAPESSTQTIQNKGSDTMVNLALSWAETFQSLNPQISITVTGGGSGTGIAALTNNTVDIANASRPIKPEEVEQIIENGVEPIEFIVARDAIAVIINHNNPINRLTLQQISEIYSGKYNNWSELGGEDRPIVRLSRETNSGTHVYFLEEVVRMGNKDDRTLFSPDTLLLPSSEGITAEVRDNPNAIGYDGLGYVTPEVKVIAVGSIDTPQFVLPSAETVNNQTYPIARDLYMYTSGEPTGAERAYLDWILSEEAQDIVKKLGFVPLLIE